MKYDYDYKITFSLNEPFDYKRINEFKKNYPDLKLLVEIQNTKGISSFDLRRIDPDVVIRIAGGYDEERIRHRGHIRYKNGETGEYYTSAVMYTRNEVINIIRSIEEIESDINKNWSDLQKLVCIYDRLKRGIMYDPKYEQKKSNEIRSLRGLITKKTVCAGYALILKEILDRQGIKCEYVEGKGHAWNIVTIEGKKYPIDLTWDNDKFRTGKYDEFIYLGQDVKKFSDEHVPESWAPTQNYEKTLSQFDPNLIKRISEQVGRSRKYPNTSYPVQRKDGTKFVITQLGNITYDGNEYYRYHYVEIDKDGNLKQPIILYSMVNVTNIVNAKRFGNPTVSESYEKYIINILFSRENILDSVNNKTFYIGDVRKKTNDNHLELVKSVDEISKPQDLIKKFRYPTKRFKRSDGTEFIVQQMLEKPFVINGIELMRYDVFEMIEENGKKILKRNMIFTERNLFVDQRQSLPDEFLSRSRLDRKSETTGGYVGYHDANGMHVSNPDFINYFKINRKIDVDSLAPQKQSINIPKFAELEKLALKYEIFMDSENQLDNDPNKIKVREISTKKVETNPEIVRNAILANIWLSSAGIKWMQNEERVGFTCAFSPTTEELYNTICDELNTSAKNNGVIDTVSLLKNITQKNKYKYNREIIVNLFRTNFQTEFINDLFLNSNGITKHNQIPETLYSLNYAGSLLSDDYGRSR